MSSSTISDTIEKSDLVQKVAAAVAAHVQPPLILVAVDDPDRVQSASQEATAALGAQGFEVVEVGAAGGASPSAVIITVHGASQLPTFESWAMQEEFRSARKHQRVVAVVYPTYLGVDRNEAWAAGGPAMASEVCRIRVAKGA